MKVKSDVTQSEKVCCQRADFFYCHEATMFRNSVSVRHVRVSYPRCETCGVELVEVTAAYPEIGDVGESTRTKCERCTAAHEDEPFYVRMRARAAKWRRN